MSVKFLSHRNKYSQRCISIGRIEQFTKLNIKAFVSGCHQGQNKWICLILKKHYHYTYYILWQWQWQTFIWNNGHQPKINICDNKHHTITMVTGSSLKQKKFCIWLWHGSSFWKLLYRKLYVLRVFYGHICFLSLIRQSLPVSSIIGKCPLLSAYLFPSFLDC